MKITKFKHENVNTDGTFSDGTEGSVFTNGAIQTTDRNKQPEDLQSLFISFTEPRTPEGTVQGVIFNFETLESYQSYINAVINLADLVGD